MAKGTGLGTLLDVTRNANASRLSSDSLARNRHGHNGSQLEHRGHTFIHRTIHQIIRQQVVRISILSHDMVHKHIGRLVLLPVLRFDERDPSLFIRAPRVDCRERPSVVTSAAAGDDLLDEVPGPGPLTSSGRRGWVPLRFGCVDGGPGTPLRGVLDIRAAALLVGLTTFRGPTITVYLEFDFGLPIGKKCLACQAVGQKSLRSQMPRHSYRLWATLSLAAPSTA